MIQKKNRNKLFTKNLIFVIFVCIPVLFLSVYSFINSATYFDYLLSGVFILGVLFIFGNGIFSRIQVGNDFLKINLFLRKNKEISFNNLTNIKMHSFLFFNFIHLYNKNNKVVVPNISIYFNDNKELRGFVDFLTSKNKRFVSFIDWDSWKIKNTMF